MEHQCPDAVLNSEEILDSFVCCVCLDLLYKPIILHCGHISCFWCVHKSMSSRYKSRCPICRNPYSHFPGICQMFHFLLLKLYPITYKKREEQILEEEKRVGYFSPEFNSHACESEADGEVNYLRSPSHSSAFSDSPSAGKEKLSKPSGQVRSHHNGTNPTKENSDRDLSQINPVSGVEKDQISVADLLCSACKQLLFRPIVLNCGHVYCQTCIVMPPDEMLRCQVCQCLHPRGFPKVCLMLDQLLAAKFPKEYALRKDSVQLKQVSSECDRASTCALKAGQQDLSPVQFPSRDHGPFSVVPRAFIHIGVGCDACGMFPIVGDRYKCKDCTEKIGFDLCGYCYNTRLKLPGRFNQRHTPEHKFELIKHDIFRGLRLMTEQLENGSTSFVLFDEPSENLENELVLHALSVDSQENTSSNLAEPFFLNESMEDEDDILF